MQILHQPGLPHPHGDRLQSLAKPVHRHKRHFKRKEHAMAKNISVMGIYPDRTTVSDAINVLHKSGYRATDISVLSSDNQGTKDFAHEKHTKAAEGAATGAAVGAVVGGAFAWLVYIHTLTIPGLMPLLAAGPFLAALAGAAA